MYMKKSWQFCNRKVGEKALIITYIDKRPVEEMRAMLKVIDLMLALCSTG